MKMIGVMCFLYRSKRMAAQPSLTFISLTSDCAKPSVFFLKFFLKDRRLLAERFGSSYKIGEAWITKVTEEASSHAHDHQGLQKFVDDLRTCEQTLTLTL